MVRKPSQQHVAVDSTGESKERKGLWSPEEDERLYNQITRHGVSTWSSVAQLAGLWRSGKSCRLRWMNYLRPDLKKEPISKREEEVIISLQQSLGNRWAAIAAKMPGRTDNEIKNYWNSRIRKRLNAAARAGTATNSAEVPSDPIAGEKEESIDNAGSADAAPLPNPARFPVFACQLVDGSAGALSPTTTTTTEQQKSSLDESDAASVGDGSAVGSNMIIHDFLAFDYPADLLMDVPGLMEAWETELYSANYVGSLN